MNSRLTGEKFTRVLWIDLDGTVRHGFDELGRFVNGPQDVVIFDGVPAILAAYKAAGWRVVGITNQGGVALGHLSFEDMAAAMRATHEQCGKAFDRIVVCIHHPDAKELEMRTCWCRKPRIGLLIEAGLKLSERFGEIYPPELGVFVGDRPEDAMCAANAGLTFIAAHLWRAGGWRKHLESQPTPPEGSQP
jgi:D-glycero-D-manno-heptose 1,7-bisphosphate phosphatase